MLSVLNTKYTVADKVFYLVTHLVDKLIEPCMHEDGIDLYANDAHVGLARVWFYTGFTIFPGGHWKRVQRAFVEAIRRRTPTSFANFDAVLTAAFQSCPGEDDRLYGAGLMAARGRLPEFIGVYQDLEVFDPACDSFIALMQKWMKDVSGLFAVTHDRSKPMARNKTFLRTLMQPAPARVIGYRGRQGELPLRISTLDFADSRALPAVQLADVIAGAAADYVLAYSGRRPVTTYHEALKTSRLPELFVGGMLPEPSIERGPDPLPGERSLVDGATDFLSELGYFRKR